MHQMNLFAVHQAAKVFTESSEYLCLSSDFADSIFGFIQNKLKK